MEPRSCREKATENGFGSTGVEGEKSKDTGKREEMISEMNRERKQPGRQSRVLVISRNNEGISFLEIDLGHRR